MNPIENLWQDIENEVEKQNPTTVNQLQDVLADAWEKIDPQTLVNLVKSMPKRCRLLYEAKGDHIHY